MGDDKQTIQDYEHYNVTSYYYMFVDLELLLTVVPLPYVLPT